MEVYDVTIEDLTENPTVGELIRRKRELGLVSYLDKDAQQFQVFYLNRIQKRAASVAQTLEENESIAVDVIVQADFLLRYHASCLEWAQDGKITIKNNPHKVYISLLKTKCRSTWL